MFKPPLAAEHVWQLSRFSIPIPGEFGDVVRSFEALIPYAPLDRIANHVATRASWSEVVNDVQRNAPHGFLLYWRAEIDALMALAGNSGRCVAYLAGNHVIEERMFRHDERVMNYVPLRVELTQHAGDDVRLTVDQPSTVLRSFPHKAVAAVGRELDGMLANIIEELGAVAPSALRQR